MWFFFSSPLKITARFQSLFSCTGPESFDSPVISKKGEFSSESQIKAPVCGHLNVQVSHECSCCPYGNLIHVQLIPELNLKQLKWASLNGSLWRNKCVSILSVSPMSSTQHLASWSLNTCISDLNLCCSRFGFFLLWLFKKKKNEINKYSCYTITGALRLWNEQREDACHIDWTKILDSQGNKTSCAIFSMTALLTLTAVSGPFLATAPI